MSRPGNNVCVVGAGVVGLLALKNLREQGLNAIAFTKDDHIGGLWVKPEQLGKTTALRATTANTSKQTNCISDFPMPDEFPMHPTAQQLGQYLNDYAKRFELWPYMQLSRDVVRVERDANDEEWLVTTRSVQSGTEQTQRFDRVVLATGLANTPKPVTIKGQSRFAGDIVHSRDFKDPAKYKNKNVLVVGVGASGCDSLVFLVQAGARDVYSSHRESYWLAPRVDKGRAADHAVTRRIMTIGRFIASWSRPLYVKLMSAAMASTHNKAFPFLKDHPAFKGRPPASVRTRLLVFSDDLAEYLRDGRVLDRAGLDEITGPRSVRFADGSVIDDLDAIIMCTGYGYDTSVLRGKGDPTDPAFASDGFKRLETARFNSRDEKFPRLFHGFVSEQYPESLAVLGHVLIFKAPIALYDLITMALAGLWSGTRPVPTAEEMRRDIDNHYANLVADMNIAAPAHWGFRTDSRTTYEWLNTTAGTGVVERLGSWGWESWKFWWHDRKFYSLLMDGTDLSAVYRLFDTGHGRKPWPGARDYIEKTNAHIKELGEKWELEQKRKGS